MLRQIKILTTGGFVIANGLCVKTVLDLAIWSHKFPSWFVPLFGAGVLILLLISTAVLRDFWQLNAIVSQPGRQAAAPWLLVIVSYFCTTAVHSFYPFQSDVLSVWNEQTAVLRFNFVLAALGTLVSIGLSLLYRRNSVPAVLSLLLFNFLLLLPNDDCRNSFNIWWINIIGASPLMYIPNIFVNLFAVLALLRIRYWPAILMMTAICVAVCLLGLGHQSDIIW